MDLRPFSRVILRTYLSAYNSASFYLSLAFQNGNIPIKLNAATIMREGVLFQKKEEEELKR